MCFDATLPPVINSADFVGLLPPTTKAERKKQQQEDARRDKKDRLFWRWLNGDKRVKKKSFTEG